MNLLNKCTEKELKLMKNAGVYLENKDYSRNENNRTQHYGFYNES